MECKRCGELLSNLDAKLITQDVDIVLTSVMCPRCGAGHVFSYHAYPVIEGYDEGGDEL